MLKNDSTDCYFEGQCEDHVWLKHMTFAMRMTRSIYSCKDSGSYWTEPFPRTLLQGKKKAPSSRCIGPLGSFVPAVFGRDVCSMSGSLKFRSSASIQEF